MQKGSSVRSPQRVAGSTPAGSARSKAAALGEIFTTQGQTREIRAWERRARRTE